MNDHLAVLIHLTAARLWQQRLQAGTVGGLKFPSESHALMRWEGRAEPGPICAMTLYSSSVMSLNLCHVQSRCPAASQAACCYHFFPPAFTGSQPAPTGSSCRLTGVGAAVLWSSPWSTSTLPSNPPCMGCIARAQCWSARPAAALSCSRFLRESSRSHSREFGNGKWPGFPGARESTPYSQAFIEFLYRLILWVIEWQTTAEFNGVYC